MTTRTHAESRTSLLQSFAELVVERQIESFHDRFGRLPAAHEPIFFELEEPTPRPMPLREVLAVVFGAVAEHPELGLRSAEQMRAFSILVLVKMGLAGDALDEALAETGRFRVH